MHAQPPRTLKRLIKQYGPELVDDPRRTESLLNDLCGQHRREIFVLVNAQKQRVPAELLAAPAWMPRQATWARLSRQLQEKLAITEDAANWAVAAWAGALDLDLGTSKPAWPWQRRQADVSPPTSAKGKRKKRQPGKVHVQYQPGPARKSKRPSTRSKRAELAIRPGSLIWPVLHREPVTKLVVWVVILLVSVSLLVVVVNAMTRPEGSDLTTAGAGLLDTAATTPDPAAGPIRSPGTGAQRDLDYLNASVTLPSAAWVTEGPLWVRQGPSTNDPGLTTLDAKTGVTVVEFSADGGWSHISLPYDGWVSNQYLSFLTDDAAKVMVQLQVRRATAGAPLAIYTRPDAASEQVGQLDPDDTLVTVAITLDGAWQRVADPVTGWIPTQGPPAAQ